MLCSASITMSNNIRGMNSETRPVLRHLFRSKTINVSELANNGNSSGNEGSREGSASPPPQPTSSCQALRHAVSALTRIDDFNLEELGGGFFANVYKATHKGTGKEMVMKINKDSANRASALREVQLMNRLSHPNILRFLGVCVHEGQLHALTEFVSGGTLESLLSNKDEELPWTLRIKMSLDIAKGMRYLHTEGVFHRDLTSKNVLIKKKDKRNYLAIIADFGLATKIPDPNALEPLPPVGCPWWMAPEVIHGTFYDQRADIFSFGIILLEIATRLDADPEYMPRTQKFGVDYVKLSEMVDYCPLDFLQFAFRCCQVMPEKRPLTQETTETLDRIYKNLRNDASRMMGRTHKRSRSEDNIIQTSDGQGNEEVFITAHNIAAAMRKEDPHYTPASHNPFASLSRLRDGRKLIEVPTAHRKLSNNYLSGIMGPGGVGKAGLGPRGRSVSVCDFGLDQGSQSLPSSPVMLRRAAEKLHQLSLHGSEALEPGLSGTDDGVTLTKHDKFEAKVSGHGGSACGVNTTGVEEEGGDSVTQSTAATNMSGDGTDLDEKRARFGSGRTRSLGSLDLWAQPSFVKTSGSGVRGSKQTQRDREGGPVRTGFCNRVNTGIKESSLENLLEPDSPTSPFNPVDESFHGEVLGGENEEFESFVNADDEDNSISTYFSVAESQPVGSTIVSNRRSSSNSQDACDQDMSRNNLVKVKDDCVSKHDFVSASYEARLRDSTSNSSLSSYLSCSEVGEAETESNGNAHLKFVTPEPFPATALPSHIFHSQYRLQAGIEANGKVAAIALARAAADNDDDGDSFAPVIAEETGSYEQEYFGKSASSM